MILAERKKIAVASKTDSFGEAMVDGRLTAPSGRKIYRLREAILYSKKLGRPLTDSEMAQFEVD